EVIGPDSPLVAYPALYDASVPEGDWPANRSVGILGIRFTGPDDMFHYGWMLVQSAPAPGEPAVVLDWAYESGPDRPIIAGDTGGAGVPAVDLPPAAEPRRSRGRSNVVQRGGTGHECDLPVASRRRAADQRRVRLRCGHTRADDRSGWSLRRRLDQRAGG